MQAEYSLQQLSPSAALPAVQEVIATNTRNKAAGRQLLQRLPFWQKAVARAKTAALLVVIYATFWPCLWCTLLLALVLRQQQRASNNSSASSSSTPTDMQHAAAPAGVAADTKTVNTRSNGSTAAAQQQLQQQQQISSRRSALVTGGKMTKALHVCRHLHSGCWRVVLLETHKYWHVGSRFSSSVDAFYTVPVPEDEPGAYVKAVAGIAKAEEVSLFIPVSAPVASLYDALAAEALPPHCLCWSLSPATTAQLDNKASFSTFAASLGLMVPAHFSVSTPQQLLQLNSQQVLGVDKRFVLKNLSYDSVHRADLVTLPCPAEQLLHYLSRPDVIISPQQPWILQEFIEGKEFSCYSLAHAGRLVAHADIAAELSNLNYKFKGVPGIFAWVNEFVTKTGTSGQLCFDFIQSTVDGRLYCIECNPRTSSVITEFHDNPQLEAVLCNPSVFRQPVLPRSDSRATFWIAHEVIRLLLNPGYLSRFISTIANGVDAVFDAADPLSFLALHYIQVPMLLLGNAWRGNPWSKVDLCIGKIAELYGD